MRFKAVVVWILISTPIIGAFGDGSVTIGRIITEIEGKTRRNAIIKELRIYEGKEFESLPESV